MFKTGKNNKHMYPILIYSYPVFSFSFFLVSPILKKIYSAIISHLLGVKRSPLTRPMRRVDGLVLHNERDLRGEQQRMTDDHPIANIEGKSTIQWYGMCNVL